MNRSIAKWVLLSIFLLSFSVASFGQVAVGISVRIGPPPLPVYAQPICPGPGYMWTPGYWAWNDDDGYYWVPGTWVVAPVGLFWTPGYWGWGDGLYVWHGGYWGPHVGFYGGINYGFGYTGVGFYGGEWRGRNFYYNRSVTNVSVTNVTNVYNRTVVVRNETHVAYNGGRGGIEARPTRQQETWARESHTPALAVQREHEHAAMQNRENFARENHGRPAIAATARPADFSRHSVVPARAAGGEYRAPSISPREARATPNAANRGNSNQGFRPFTPPSKGGAANNERGGNNANRNDGRLNDNRPSSGRTNENRPPQNRGTQNRINENRPSENRPAQTQMRENRPNESRPAQNQMRENRPNQSRPNENRMTETRPQNQPREASRPQSPPHENSRPAPAPRQGPAPKEDHHRGR
jgi:WXXGXW repeat (2 copies)